MSAMNSRSGKKFSTGCPISAVSQQISRNAARSRDSYGRMIMRVVGNDATPSDCVVYDKRNPALRLISCRDGRERFALDQVCDARENFIGETHRAFDLIIAFDDIRLSFQAAQRLGVNQSAH